MTLTCSWISASFVENLVLGAGLQVSSEGLFLPQHAFIYVVNLLEHNPG